MPSIISVSTLNDLQKFLSTIWVRPFLGVTAGQLYPLFQLLKGNPEFNSPCTLIPRATGTLEQIAPALSSPHACRKVDGIPVNFCLNFIENSYCSPVPASNACMVFTDGSGKTSSSVIVWQSNRQWLQNIKVVHGSSQLADLAAVVRAFNKLQDELNTITDSAYLAGTATKIEEAYSKEVTNPLLFSLLLYLHFAVQLHMKRCYILHVCSHTSLPGSISEGNACADQLAEAVVVPHVLSQAHLSHEFFTRVQQLFENNFSLDMNKHSKLCKPVLTVNR